MKFLHEAIRKPIFEFAFYTAYLSGPVPVKGKFPIKLTCHGITVSALIKKQIYIYF